MLFFFLQVSYYFCKFDTSFLLIKFILPPDWRIPSSHSPNLSSLPSPILPLFMFRKVQAFHWYQQNMKYQVMVRLSTFSCVKVRQGKPTKGLKSPKTGQSRLCFFFFCLVYTLHGDKILDFKRLLLAETIYPSEWCLSPSVIHWWQWFSSLPCFGFNVESYCHSKGSSRLKAFRLVWLGKIAIESNS